MKRNRILLCDDHRLVAECLKGLLEPEFELLEIVGNGRAMLDAVHSLDPDVVVLDISMPLLNGIEAAEKLQKEKARVKVIFLTMHLDVAYVKRALDVGAVGYVSKHSAPSELVTAIHRALKGQIYVTQIISGKVLKSFLDDSKKPETKRKQPNLTLRQREVLQLLAEGRTAKEVASLLYISPRTVEFHKYRIMKDLNIHAHADMLRFAFEHGIASS